MDYTRRILSIVSLITFLFCLASLAAIGCKNSASTKAPSKVIAGQDGSLTVNAKPVNAKKHDVFGPYDVTDNAEGYTYSHILHVMDGETAFVETAFPDSVISSEGISGGTLSIDGDHINGISVEGGDYRIENIRIHQTGDGVCDFLLFGNAIGIAGGNVVVDNVTVNTLGDIVPALNAGGDANVVVMNSNFSALGTAGDATGLHSGKLPFSGYKGAITEVPWVLGLYGTLRATNLIGKADIVYYNTRVEANGWGVFSTDGGATHTLINSTGYLDGNGTFGSGYGTYVLKLPVNYLGLELDVPTYGIAARNGFNMLESSPENLAKVDNDAMSMFKKELGGDFSSIETCRNKITARHGIMAHGTDEGTINISGTDFHVSGTAFLMKDAYMNIEVSDTTFNFSELPEGGYGIILHAMKTDDAGIDMYTYDNCWAICSTFMYGDPEPVEVTNEINANFTGETLKGHFYNTMSNGGRLNLVFDDSSVAGAISSASYRHKNASYHIVGAKDGGFIAVDAKGRAYKTLHQKGMMPGVDYYYPETDADGNFIYSDEAYDPSLIVGYCIFYDDAGYLGEVDITTERSISNPVFVELKNGSVWDVAEVSYLNGYTVDDTSTIKGAITELEDGTYRISP